MHWNMEWIKEVSLIKYFINQESDKIFNSAEVWTIELNSKNLLYWIKSF